ncbi:hypothetical protein C0J52_26245 [Blattella germanica]|nr:hypothetical protein C0J52_26245 [Blattella germanica]
MCSKEEQRDWIRKEYDKHGSAKKCHQELEKKFGADALPYATVAWWVRQFKEARESVSDMPGRRPPPLSDKEVAVLRKMVQANPKLTIPEMAKSTGLSVSTVYRTLNDRLKMQKVGLNWVSTDLTNQVCNE